MDKIGWQLGDVDLFEINEAFAVVAMVRSGNWSLIPTGSISTAAHVRWGTLLARAGHALW